MTQHFNGLTEAEQERLAILIEECGEVVQAACKILRHGYESKNPTIPQSETNRQALEREIGDVMHTVNRLLNSDLNGSAVAARAASKAARMLPYLHHQGITEVA